MRSTPRIDGQGPHRLTPIEGMPPNLIDPNPLCPFLPRCAYGTDACTQVDMSLAHVRTSGDPAHVTACPFVLPETPVRSRGDGPAGAQAPTLVPSAPAGTEPSHEEVTP